MNAVSNKGPPSTTNVVNKQPQQSIKEQKPGQNPTSQLESKPAPVFEESKAGGASKLQSKKVSEADDNELTHSDTLYGLDDMKVGGEMEPGALDSQMGKKPPKKKVPSSNSLLALVDKNKSNTSNTGKPEQPPPAK